MKKIFLKNKVTAAVFLISMRFARRFRRHNLSEYSAYSVMFIILSFVPFFIILLNIIKSFPVFSEAEGYRITTADQLTEFLRKLLRDIDVKASGALLSVTSILSLWSASRGLIGIINGLNRIHNTKEHRGFIKIRLYSLVYTLLLMAVIIIVLVILIFGESLLKQAETLFSVSFDNSGNIFTLRWGMGFLLLVMFFALIYCALPIQKSKPLAKLPGAVFSAGGWTGFSVLYALYVEHFADYPSLYGSLAFPVTAILWLYICIYILFIGEELNLMLETGSLRRFSDIISLTNKH